jgi:hypothetical protein
MSVSEAPGAAAKRFSMRELEVRTTRVRRGWLDRLRGYKHVYETELTDGEHVAHGRGPTREASEQSAKRNWDAKFSSERES